MQIKRFFAKINIFFLFIILCAACAYIGYIIIAGNSADTDAITKKSENIEMSNITVCEVFLPDIYEYTMSESNIGNLDSRAALADKLRENTDLSLDRLDCKTTDTNVKIYSLRGSTVRADVPSGYDGLDCGRSYYFNNNRLYLADFYKDSRHETMYFSDNTLFRRAISDGTVSDNLLTDDAYCFAGNFALNEGISFLK